MSSAREKLDGEITAIDKFDRRQLAARWTKIYGQDPPSIRRDLLSHAVAWDLQAKRLGGYSPETRRRLKQTIAKVEDDLSTRNLLGNKSFIASVPGDIAAPAALSFNPPSVPSVGARLVRVWNGHTNVVDVVAGGYLFEGEVYRSLSAIARKITNAHWSGPRFFGL